MRDKIEREWKKSGIAVTVSNGNNITNLENLVLQARKALDDHMENKGFMGPLSNEIKIDFSVEEDKVCLKMSCRYYIDGRYAVYEQV